MFNIAKNGIITITRGDSAETSLYINIGTELEPEKWILADNDQVYLGIMEPNQLFEDAIVKKLYTKGNYTDKDDPEALTISFDCEDTENLLPGVYYYSIKLYRHGNSDPKKGPITKDRIDTIVPKRKFIIVD